MVSYEAATEENTAPTTTLSVLVHAGARDSPYHERSSGPQG